MLHFHCLGNRLARICCIFATFPVCRGSQAANHPSSFSQSERHKLYSSQKKTKSGHHVWPTSFNRATEWWTPMNEASQTRLWRLKCDHDLLDKNLRLCLVSDPNHWEFYQSTVPHGNQTKSLWDRSYGRRGLELRADPSAASKMCLGSS